MAALSPSVNALTPHPRYHSLYTFLVDEFWRRDDLPRTRSAFREFFRQREWAYSLAAQFCSSHRDMTGIVGSGTTGPLSQSGAEVFSYDPDYIVSDFGGYGLYYYYVMTDLGFIYPGGIGMPTPVDIPSERGKELAAAFRAEIAETDYYKDFFSGPQVDLPKDVLAEYAGTGCLCQGKREDAADRRLILRASLQEGGAERAHARRESLRLFLDLAKQSDGHALTEADFRELLYFGADTNGTTFAPKPALLVHSRRWRLFQAREYYVFALNGLWSHLCGWGREMGGDVVPLSLEAIWEHLDEAIDFEGLAALLECEDPGLGSGDPLSALFEWLLSTASASSPDSFDACCSLAAPVQESSLHRLAMTSWKKPCVQVSGMLTMLALIYLRYSPPELSAREDWVFATFGEPDRLSIARFVADVRRKLAESTCTIGGLLRWLMKEYVVRQHQLVAFRKLPDDTFRFRFEGGGMRFFSDPALAIEFGFTDPRLYAMGTTVHELGLCGNLYEEEHGLTADGVQLLEQGDVV